MPEYQQELASTHNNLGILLARPGPARRGPHGVRDGPRPATEAGRRLPRRARIPTGTWPAPTTTWGFCWPSLGQRDAARTEYETARDLLQKLAAAFPAVPEYQQDLASTHNNLGILLADLGQRDAARTEYETARDLQKKLVAAFPAVPEYQQDLARTHNNLGMLLADLGQHDAARTEYETARDLHKKLAAAFPAVPDTSRNWPRTHNNLGILLAELWASATRPARSTRRPATCGRSWPPPSPPCPSTRSISAAVTATSATWSATKASRPTACTGSTWRSAR